MYVSRKQIILKYWLHIIVNKPPIVYDVYQLLLEDANNGKKNWASSVRDLLFNLGLNYVWTAQNYVNIQLDVIKTRIKDQYLQTLYASINDCEKLCIYKHLKTDFVIENYLDFFINSNLLTKLRSGTLKLNLELGRYKNIPRHMRLCECCNMACIENEYHFVLVCPAYRTVRQEHLPKYYCSWPNNFKLFHLLQAKSKSITIKLSEICLEN